MPCSICRSRSRSHPAMRRKRSTIRATVKWMAAILTRGLFGVSNDTAGFLSRRFCSASTAECKRATAETERRKALDPIASPDPAKARAAMKMRRSLPIVCGQGLADFEADAWFAFVLPKGTPAAIVQKLHNATVATMSAPATGERLKEFGSVLVAPDRRSPEYLQKFIQSETEKWAAFIKAANIKPE
jgi:Tripartite tricarboxylate transporter family receptor